MSRAKLKKAILGALGRDGLKGIADELEIESVDLPCLGCVVKA